MRIHCFGTMGEITALFPDLVVHGIAGFLGSLAVVYLHASLTSNGYVQSQQSVFKHLEELAKTLPEELQVLVAKYIGYFGAFILIIILAVAFGFVGKLAAPPLSAAFYYFGDRDAQLWVEHRQEIFDAEERLQTAKGQSTPDWVAFQNSLGRYPVRTARALLPFTIVLIIAGAIDVCRRRFMARGISVLVAGTCFFLVAILMWSNWQGDYVRQLRVEYNRFVQDDIFPRHTPSETATPSD